MAVESLTLEQALLVLSLPKALGAYPESGVEITARDGPNGPYLRMGDETRSLRDHEHLGTVTLDDAVTLFAAPKQRGRRSGPAEIAALGEHPDSGEPVRLLQGRYGPYATDGTVNASIPKGRDPVNVTLEEAVDLIAAREQRLRDQGKDPRAPKPKRPRRSGGSRRKRSA
jgi:DNA topoisomerase-1